MWPIVSCSGGTGGMAEAFLLHSLGTQCWLHTSFNPGRKNSKKFKRKNKKDYFKNPNLPKSGWVTQTALEGENKQIIKLMSSLKL